MEHPDSFYERIFNALLIIKDRPVLLPYRSTVKWNVQLGYNATLNLTGNAKLVVTGFHPGSYGSIDITQDSVGSRTITLQTGSIVVNGGGGIITLTTNPGSKDTLNFKCDKDGFLRWTKLPNFN